MKRFSLNLPTRKRLDVKLVNRRELEEKPLLPDMGEIRRAKKGNKISRFFRHVFENKRIKRFLGSNLTFLFLASSLIPSYTLQGGEAEDVVVAQQTTPLTTEKTIQYPVEGTVINQGYRLFHPGIDFEGKTGDNVYSIMPGIVEAVQYSNYAYGNAIYVSHKEGYSSLYAHLSRIFVETGDNVDMWSAIGDVGSTGRSSGDHLHLEVHKNGTPINPFILLP